MYVVTNSERVPYKALVTNKLQKLLKHRKEEKKEEFYKIDKALKFI